MQWAETEKVRTFLPKQCSYFKQPSVRFAIAPISVVYTKAGTLPAVAVIQNQLSIVDRTLCWARVKCNSITDELGIFFKDCETIQFSIRTTGKCSLTPTGVFSGKHRLGDDLISFCLVLNYYANQSED